MKKTEESLRRLKKGRQTAFSLFSGTGAGNDEDEERIRTQMILDVDAFARDAETLGVDPTASQAFKVLLGMVHATWLDGGCHYHTSLQRFHRIFLVPDI
jgi:hypothetical protein